jgi:AcrR family transcriptional regulator
MGNGGRPRQFDVDKAIDVALEVFWRSGYEGTSLTQLTSAMGINRPALYAAFGSKQELFARAIERYYQGDAAYTAKALDEPTARQAAIEYLHRNVDQVTGAGHPAGCFVVQSALTCGPENATVRQDLANRRRRTEQTLRDRFERAAREGDLDSRFDAGDLATYLSTLSEGLSVQAADGASAERLHRAVDIALQVAFPAAMQTEK